MCTVCIQQSQTHCSLHTNPIGEIQCGFCLCTTVLNVRLMRTFFTLLRFGTACIQWSCVAPATPRAPHAPLGLLISWYDDWGCRKLISHDTAVQLSQNEWIYWWPVSVFVGVFETATQF